MIAPGPTCGGCRRSLSLFGQLPHDEIACRAAHTQRSKILVFGKAGSLRWGEDPPEPRGPQLEHKGADTDRARQLESAGAEK